MKNSLLAEVGSAQIGLGSKTKLPSYLSFGRDRSEECHVISKIFSPSEGDDPCIYLKPLAVGDSAVDDSMW